MAVSSGNEQQHAANPPRPKGTPDRMMPPWAPRNDDLGLATVDEIAAGLQLDSQWSLPTERGFTWWGKDLAQHVWADPAIREAGGELFRLHARTELVSGFAAADKNLAAVDALAGYATTSAFLVDAPAGTVSLAASMWTHADVEGWVRRLFGLVAAVQATDAQIKAPLLAEMTGATLAASSHPKSGQRVAADDMLHIIEYLVAPQGQQSSRWAGHDMQHTFEMVRDSPFSLCATGGEDGFTAEFPFQSGSSLLRALTTVAHPQVGHGLLLLLSIPPQFSADEGLRHACELNRRELETPIRAQTLGAWCWRNDVVTHCSFVPNAFRLGGADLINLIYSEVARARWVAETIYGDDWEKNRDPTGRPLASRP